MNEQRIKQLEKEGFSAEEAQGIATAEAKRAAELIAEGFATDKAPARAQREVRFARLVTEKIGAGLSREQAEAVANAQIDNDARVAAEAVKAAEEKTALEKLQAENAELKAKLAAATATKKEAAK